MLNSLILSVIDTIPKSTVISKIKQYLLTEISLDMTNVSLEESNDKNKFRLKIYNWAGNVSYNEALTKPKKLASYIERKYSQLAVQVEEETQERIPKTDKQELEELAIELSTVNSEAEVRALVGSLAALKEFNESVQYFDILDEDTSGLLADILKQPTSSIWNTK